MRLCVSSVYGALNMNKPIILSLLAASLAAFVTTNAIADTDGEKLFKRKCASCHTFEKHGVGPNLDGVIGRKAGSTDYPKYKGLKDADFVWDENNLDEWIKNPKKFLGKSTSMAGKIKKEKDRVAILEFLKAKMN